MKRRIAAAWLSYRRAVLPSNANGVQLDETRKAFYAGAVSFMPEVVSIGEDSVTENVGVATLQELAAELMEYRAETEVAARNFIAAQAKKRS